MVALAAALVAADAPDKAARGLPAAALVVPGAPGEAASALSDYGVDRSQC